MCTALAYKTKDLYFGRTLDYESSYGEEIVITPRQYPFSFLYEGKLASHYAIIGMAHVVEGYPLYYEAVNEKGLGMAGLNFVGNACYGKEKQAYTNVATYEFIPWVLGQFCSVHEVRKQLQKVQLVGATFRDKYPASKLHWMIADEQETITVEMLEDGLHIYDNPVGVLTNNPPFPQQMLLLQQYRHLSPKQPENLFAPTIPLGMYSRGMGAIGLPGDLSSASRFARAAFTKLHAQRFEKEEDCVSQFFHIMDTVSQQKGCCQVEEGCYEYTIYTSCCNASKGIFYYTTYENRQITAVAMTPALREGDTLVVYPMRKEAQFYYEKERN